jgi:hypothetical protein
VFEQLSFFNIVNLFTSVSPPTNATGLENVEGGGLLSLNADFGIFLIVLAHGNIR